MTDSPVEFRISEGVATITMQSPENRNALSLDMRRGLRSAFSDVAASNEVRLVVLDHTGPTFCAGADLKNPPAPGEPDPFPFAAVLETMWDLPKPIVTLVRGSARAGGIGLIACSDIVVASTKASFAFSEVRIGAVPAVISVPVLRRSIGSRIGPLLLTGETFMAAEALDAGLVDVVESGDRIDAEADRFRAHFLAAAPGALAATKSLLRRDRTLDFSVDVEQMTRLSVVTFASTEAREGISAFREKRRPSWAPDIP